MPQRWITRIDLELENIALFREYTMELESGTVVEASGGNGRGKTTLLNAALIALTGKGIEDFLVTYGEERGLIKTRIDGLFIKRVIENGKTTDLEVVDESGNIVKRPQTFLNNIFGAGAFLNPVEVVNMKPAERAKAVAAALDLDPAVAREKLEAITGMPVTITTREDIFPAISKAHDTFYEMRRQKRNDAEAAEAQAVGVESFIPKEWLDANGDVPPPVEPAPLGDIYDRKRSAEVRNAEREQLATDIAELEQVIRRGEEQTSGDELHLGELDTELQRLGLLEDEVALEEQIRRLQQQLADMRERNQRRRLLTGRIENARTAIAQNKARLDEYRERLTSKCRRERELGAMEDVSALQAQIDRHEDQMTMYRQAVAVHGERRVRYEQRDTLREKAAALQTEWEDLQAKVRAIDELPLQLLEGVKLPITGMQISGEDIFLPEGDKLLNLDAFGEADKYRYCTQLAMALAPVNLIVMDGVERCDEDRRRELYQLIADAGFVAFSTRVTGGALNVKPVAQAATNRTTIPEVCPN